MIPKSCLLMHLIIIHFETGLVKKQTLRNIYIWIKGVFKSGKFFWLCYCHAKPNTYGMHAVI